MITDGKISRLGEAGSAAGRAGAEHIDAAGCYVLPGGVDPHCHLMAQVALRHRRGGARRDHDRAVVHQSRGGPERPGRPAFAAGTSWTADRAVVDVGLHAMIYDPEHVSAADLAAARRAGAAAIKIFLAYPELGIMCSTRRLCTS